MSAGLTAPGWPLLRWLAPMPARDEGRLGAAIIKRPAQLNG